MTWRGKGFLGPLVVVSRSAGQALVSPTGGLLANNKAIGVPQRRQRRPGGRNPLPGRPFPAEWSSHPVRLTPAG